MSKDKDVVFTLKIEMTKQDITSVIDQLNLYEIDEDEGESNLTFDQVVNNKKLLSYLCGELVNVEYDIFEIWNSDGFCDFRDYL